MLSNPVVEWHASCTLPNPVSLTDWQAGPFNDGDGDDDLDLGGGGGKRRRQQQEEEALPVVGKNRERQSPLLVIA